MTSRGLDYAGKQSVTNTGKTCEHWTDGKLRCIKFTNR